MTKSPGAPGWKKQILLSLFGLLISAGLLEAGLRVVGAIQEARARSRSD